jgi:hypothetical protein
LRLQCLTRAEKVDLPARIDVHEYVRAHFGPGAERHTEKTASLILDCRAKDLARPMLQVAQIHVPLTVYSPELTTCMHMCGACTCAHMCMSGHHPATVRLAGRKRHARFESSEALAEQPALAHTAVELHGCCARVSLAEALSSVNILTAWLGQVAQAPRAGRARAPWSCTPCWRPSSRTARLEDQLRLDDEVNSEIVDSFYATGSSARHGVAVGHLPASTASARSSWSSKLWVLRERIPYDII